MFWIITLGFETYIELPWLFVNMLSMSLLFKFRFTYLTVSWGVICYWIYWNEVESGVESRTIAFVELAKGLICLNMIVWCPGVPFVSCRDSISGLVLALRHFKNFWFALGFGFRIHAETKGDGLYSQFLWACNLSPLVSLQSWMGAPHK